jgi:hypothetical protein
MMQEVPGEAYLREMAMKCRLLAGQLHDESAAASLRKLALEYEQAADAVHQRTLFDAMPRPPNLQV